MVLSTMESQDHTTPNTFHLEPIANTALGGLETPLNVSPESGGFGLSQEISARNTPAII